MDKYRATIHGNTIEWEGDEPESLKTNGTVTVDVIPVRDSTELPKSDGKKMAAALRELAKLHDSHGLKSIKDPVKWQREIRKDRPLPGR